MGKKVGKLIKAARTDADMTQEQLARKVKVTASDISAAERGTKDLTQAQLKLIAKATGVTQASLLNAAKEEKGTATKSSSKTTTKSSSKMTTKNTAKTPSNANKTMKVTATEKKLIEAYRLADSDTKKRAMSILKDGSTDMVDVFGDMVQDFVGGLMGD